jgi:hypothetical protein
VPPKMSPNCLTMPRWHGHRRGHRQQLNHIASPPRPLPSAYGRHHGLATYVRFVKPHYVRRRGPAYLWHGGDAGNQWGRSRSGRTPLHPQPIRRLPLVVAPNALALGGGGRERVCADAGRTTDRPRTRSDKRLAHEVLPREFAPTNPDRPKRLHNLEVQNCF